MPITIDTDVVSRNIFSLAFASLDAAKQADVTAAVARAKEKVSQYAQHADYGDGADGPGVWDNWAELEAEMILARQHRLERIETLRRMASEAEDAAIETFVSRAFNASTAFSATLTLQGLRQHIAAAGLRARPRKLLDPMMIDNIVHSVVNEIWNGSQWHFRRRPATMTIAANGTVTFDLAGGEVFDSFATRKWYYTDVRDELEWAQGDAMQMMRANTAETGRPRFIRTVDKGSTKAFTLHPAPDKQYTLRGEVFIAGPAIPANATDATWLDLFPTEFRTAIRDMCVLRAVGFDTEAQGRLMSHLGALQARFADTGWMMTNTGVRDVYEDWSYAMGNPGGPRLGSIGGGL